MKRKLLVVGLDSAPAEIVFDRAAELPVLRSLMERGLWGTMRSSDPPITIPAWMVMATGRDPADLGLYGFRHRTDYSYDKMWIATSQSVKAPKVWDHIGRAGGRSCLVSVPPSYPPPEVPGWLISCFITPGPDKEYTHPRELKEEIEQVEEAGGGRFVAFVGRCLARAADADVDDGRTVALGDLGEIRRRRGAGGRRGRQRDRSCSMGA